MLLRCVKPIKGFTVGKEYEVLGCVAEYVELIDDDDEKAILYESYFEPIK